MQTHSPNHYPKHLPASKFIQQKATTLRLKDYNKFLYIKKQNLNQQLLQLHLLLANSWNKSWPYIQNMIKEKPNDTLKINYKKLHAKLVKLIKEQIMTPPHTHTRESLRPKSLTTLI